MTEAKDNNTVMKKALVPKENYMRLLDETCIIVRKMHTEVLGHYHKLGEKIAELTERPDTYGQKTVEVFAQDLHKKGVQLGVDSLYNAQQVFKNITVKQLKQVKSASMPLRQLLLLCRKSVSDDTRQAVIDEASSTYDNGGTFDIEESISKKSGNITPSNTTTPTVDVDKDVKRMAKILKSAETMIGDLENKLKEIGAGIESICIGDNVDRIKDAYAHFEDANLAFDSMIEVWRIQVNKANKAFKNVVEIIEE